MKLGSRAKPAIPPVEPGAYFAVCIGVLDLGEQETSFNGKTRYVNQIQLIFELPTERIEVDGGMQPRWLSRRFTMSTSPRSGLRQFLETWHGKKFSDDTISEFELFDLLGKAAMLTVVLSEDGNYANIAGASALPKGVPAPVATSPYLAFDIAEWDDAVFASLPDYLQELIKRSTQYKNAHLPEVEVSVAAAELAAAEEAGFEEVKFEGVIPF